MQCHLFVVLLIKLQFSSTVCGCVLLLSLSWWQRVSMNQSFIVSAVSNHPISNIVLWLWMLWLRVNASSYFILRECIPHKWWRGSFICVSTLFQFYRRFSLLFFRITSICLFRITLQFMRMCNTKKKYIACTSSKRDCHVHTTHVYMGTDTVISFSVYNRHPFSAHKILTYTNVHTQSNHKKRVKNHKTKMNKKKFCPFEVTTIFFCTFYVFSFHWHFPVKNWIHIYADSLSKNNAHPSQVYWVENCL